jgi:hypothetical protein
MITPPDEKGVTELEYPPAMIPFEHDQDATARLQKIEAMGPSASNGEVTTYDGRIVFRIQTRLHY